MSNVTIGGVEYLPASVLAKQYRYTTDYIGQLCRAKKVDAKLVGRTWYVNPNSLTSHKKGRYSKQKEVVSESEITYNIAIHSEKSRIEVAPALSKTTVKMIRPPLHFTGRIEAAPIRYEDDNQDLLPSLRKRESTPERLAVTLADSVPVEITQTSKNVRMVATAVPEVSLQGKLSIHSLDEILEPEAKDAHFSASLSKESTVSTFPTPSLSQKPSLAQPKKPPLPGVAAKKPRFIKKTQSNIKLDAAAYTYNVPVHEGRQSVVATHEKMADVEGVRKRSFLIPAVIVLAVCVGGLALVLGVQSEATKNNTTTTYFFEPIWQ